MSSIAAVYAFFPPNPPSYRLVADESTSTLRILEISSHSPSSSSLRLAVINISKLRTWRGTDIIAVYIKNHRSGKPQFRFSMKQFPMLKFEWYTSAEDRRKCLVALDVYQLGDLLFELFSGGEADDDVKFKA